MPSREETIEKLCALIRSSGICESKGSSKNNSKSPSGSYGRCDPRLITALKKEDLTEMVDFLDEVDRLTRKYGVKPRGTFGRRVGGKEAPLEGQRVPRWLVAHEYLHSTGCEEHEIPDTFRQDR